ncbi:MAG: hypothetical protein WC489_00520 [Patescibacteria group bacterium]
MKKIDILILEDDTEALSVIFRVLSQLGEMAEFRPVVLSTYLQVEKLMNDSDMDFDIILLDRDCALGGSFHTLNIEKFGPEKVIAISMHLPYNEELKKRGVTKTVLKTVEDMRKFEDGLFGEIQRLIT